MKIQPLNLLSAQPAARTYALLSVGAALITIILKFTAYLLTGSVGLLSDALESVVNLVAALVAVWALTLAIRPADADHVYGHFKAEYIGPAAFGIAGPLLALATSGGLAVSTIIVKRMHPQIDVLALTAWQLIAGSLPLLAASAVAERGSAIVWSSVFIALLVFLALIGTAVANAGWYWLIRREDVGRLTLFFFLVPVLGLGIAALAFGETLGPLEGTGVTLMLAGIGAVAWESWHGGTGSQAEP